MKIEFRPIQESDAGLIYNLFLNLEWGKSPKSESDFVLWVKQQVDKSKGIGLEEKYVSVSTYLLWIDDIPVGVSSIRLLLNPTLEQLEYDCGHIGYAIGSDFRGRGYANILIAETLKQAKEKDIEKVLITTDDDNIPSWKAIEHNGGILYKTEPDPENGKLTRYYWITLS